MFIIPGPIALINYPVLSNYPLQYHLDDVECSGSEDMLSDCAHGGIGVHDCMEMAEVAGVICSGEFFLVYSPISGVIRVPMNVRVQRNRCKTG